MRIKIVMLLISGIVGAASVCLAQARDAGVIGSGVSTTADGSLSGGADSGGGEHGIAGSSADLGQPFTPSQLGNRN